MSQVSCKKVKTRFQTIRNIQDDIKYVQKEEPKIGLIGRAHSFFQSFHKEYRISYIVDSILEADNKAYMGSCTIIIKASKCTNTYNIDLIKVEYSVEETNHTLCLGLCYHQGAHIGLDRGDRKCYIVVTAKDITDSSSTANPCNLI